MNSKLPKYKIIIAFGILAFVVITSFVLIWLSRPQGERFLTLQIEGLLTKILLQPVNIDKLETNIFSRVEVTGLTVVSTADPPAIVIGLPSLRLRYGLLRMVVSGISLDSVLITSLNVDLRRDSLGRFNLNLLNAVGDADTKKKSGKPLRFAVKYIDIPTSQLAYNDQRIQIGGALKGLASIVQLHDLSRIEFALNAESIDFSHADKYAFTGDLFLSGGWRSPNLVIDSLSLLSDDLKVTSSGRIAFTGSSPGVEAKLELEGYLPTLFDSLEAVGIPSNLSGAGLILADVTMTGTFSEPAFEARATADDLIWEQVVARELSVSAKALRLAEVWAIATTVECTLTVDTDSLSKPVRLFTIVTFADSAITIKDFALSLPDIVLAGSVEFWESGDQTLVDGSVTVKGSLTEAADIAGAFTLPSIAEIEGTADLALVISGSLSDPYLSVAGSLPLLQRGELVISNLKLKGEYAKGSIRIDQIDGDVAKGRLTIQGDLETASLRHHLALRASNIDLYKIWSGLFKTRSPFEGFINADVVSSGPLTNPAACKLVGSVSLDTVEYADLAVPPFTSSFRADSGRVVFNFVQGESKIEAHGVLQRDSLSGEFTVHLPEIKPYAALANIESVSGALDAKGTISGSYPNPTVRLTINGTGCSYSNFPADTIRADLSFVNRTLDFENVFVTGKITEIDTTQPPFGMAGFTGNLTYTVKMHGTIADPVASLEVDVSDFNYHNVRLQSGRIAVASIDRTITLKEMQLDSDSLRITGTGYYSIDSAAGDVSLNFASSKIDSLTPDPLQGSLEVEYSYLQGSSGVRLSGRSIPIGPFLKMFGLKDVNGKLDVLMTAQVGEEMRIDQLELRVREVSISKARLDSVTLKGTLDSREINLTELNGYGQATAFHAFGKLGKDPRQKESAWFDNNNFIDAGFMGRIADFAIFQPLLPVGDSATGSCDIDVSVVGKLNRPTIKGTVKLTDGSLRSGGEKPLLDSLQVDIAISDTVALVNYLAGNYQGVPLLVNAEVKFRSVNWFNVDAKINIRNEEAVLIVAEVRRDSLNAVLTLHEFDLALIEPLVPGIDALGGVASAEVKITGSRKFPDFAGQVAADKLYLSPVALADSISNCSLRVSFDRRGIDLTTFYGELGDGTILASGGYIFAEASSTSKLTVKIKDSKVINSDKYTFIVKQGEISVSKSDRKTLIEGDLVFGESHLRSRFTPKMIIAMFRATERPVKAQSKFLEKIRLDVKVHDSEEIWIDNNLARAKLRADLAITGSPAKPVISGRISTVEGYVVYLDRKFNVEHASLDFYDPHRINPNIDLLATTEVKSYKSREETPHTVSLVINGELDKAIVSLTSVPPEDLSDIVALLTLGITRRDLTGVDGKQGDVKFQEAVRERVEMITSRRLSGYLSSNVENYLGLTSFTIENNLFQFDKNWGPQLIASKKLSKRTELTYTTTVGRINDQGIKLAYKLTERLAIEGQTDQIGRSGIDLTYKMKLP